MTRRIELVAAAFVILGAMLLAALATDHGILFTRPLWLDEYHTVLVASRGSPAQVVSDLARGADLAPPLLHLATWSLRQIAGDLTATLLHAMSFITVWIGVVLVYATLRRRFDVLSATAGTVAVASHPLVIAHTFEARYYGPWLALCALFCWSVGLDPDIARSHRRAMAVAIAAMLVSTIHWFGVLTLGLMCLGAAIAAARHPFSSSPGSLAPGERSAPAFQWTRGIRFVAPAAAGLVVLLVCLPLLFRQRSLFTTPIWVSDLNGAQVFEMAHVYFLTVMPLLAAIILLASTFGARPVSFAAARDPGIAAMLALALMPLVIVVVSWLVQPTMLPRYAIATALAWGPLAAFAAQTLKRTARALWCALLLATFWVHVRIEAAEKRSFASSVQSDVGAFEEAVPTGIPIVFQSRHVLYPVAAMRPDQRASMTLLVLPDPLLDAMFPVASPVGPMARLFRFERDAVHQHVNVYGFPRLVTVAQLDSLPRFLLLARDASLPRGYKNAEVFGRAVFPAFRVSRLRENLALFVR